MTDVIEQTPRLATILIVVSHVVYSASPDLNPRPADRVSSLARIARMSVRANDVVYVCPSCLGLDLWSQPRTRSHDQSLFELGSSSDDWVYRPIASPAVIEGLAEAYFTIVYPM